MERIKKHMKRKLLALSAITLLFTGCGAADVTVTEQGVASEALGLDAGSEAPVEDTTATDETAQTEGETEESNIAGEGMTIVDGVATEITSAMLHEKPSAAPATDPNIYRKNGYILVDAERQPTYPNPEEGSPEVLPETGGDQDNEEGTQTEMSDDDLDKLLDSLSDD